MAFAIDASIVALVREAYFRPWLMTCPSIVANVEVDCIWGYAFGRNSYPDATLGVTLAEILGKLRDDQIDAFGLLNLRHFQPGDQNEQLGREIKRFVIELEAKGHKPTLINQWEINFCIWKLNPTWFSKRRDRIVNLWAPRDKPYYNSLDVTKDAIAQTRKRNLSQPALFAHNAHRVRPLTICWKQGWSPIVPKQNISGFD